VYRACACSINRKATSCLPNTYYNSLCTTSIRGSYNSIAFSFSNTISFNIFSCACLLFVFKIRINLGGTHTEACKSVHNKDMKGSLSTWCRRRMIMLVGTIEWVLVVHSKWSSHCLVCGCRLTSGLPTSEVLLPYTLDSTHALYNELSRDCWPSPHCAPSQVFRPSCSNCATIARGSSLRWS
jgi:hypothetical protein